ncbi:glycoside hydrolase family protein [Ancylobacter sp. Lp-2]|uniref:glycosyl hydrolase n=1 Tax=Ancylobacter sp. Lp-2 TaxID=2881339 RepID=UPI001E3FBBBB|nr:glycosyl hydrolase [Ancylobacter sp. Lp-2]MCB4769603.1 glycoside hydrolase family protein [Ancylobacter sp. Lp-2]
MSGAGAAYRILLTLLASISLCSPCWAEIDWGVNGHPVVSYSGVTIDEQLDLVEKLGMRSYRVDIYSTEQMDRLSALIEAGRKRRITILPALILPARLDEQDVEELYKAAYELASAFAMRFDGTVPVWELGNEMENYALIRPCEMRDDGTKYPCEWGIAGGVGPLDYFGPRYVKVAAVLRGLSDGVKASNPSARRAIGTAGWGHLGIFDRLHQDGIAWDISVWHMYGEDPEPGFKHLATFGKPIWVTEFNHPYGSQGGAAEQAQGLIKWMKRLEELSGPYKVEAAHIYELFDEPYWAPSYEAFMGLYTLTPRPDGGWQPAEPKPAFLAVQEFIADAHR